MKPKSQEKEGANNMHLTELARKTDISCVQAFHTRDEIDAMIEAAIHCRFAAAFTLPAFSSYVAEKLAPYPDIHAGGVISFPGGGDTTSQKYRQAKELYKAGCEELDMVMNLTALRSHEDQYVLEDIAAVREAAGKDILKVIIEAPQLTGEEIHRAVNLCIQAGADYVKTSTGWYPSHPSVLSHIQLMSDAAKGRIKIKAAGGIRTLETIRAMEKAGCDRFGISISSALKLFHDLY
jgi:deoxyribose-phosphate aldolase